ncbi:MAG: transglutaminase-like domain-containing protein [Methanobacteriaceae archaeon]|nr:transglutaminase-like domain-containing protein [Methanobacteriaceae archaeon]MDO9627996.1 transglutaminase-like domain-containing protein [Methanobacteriaceae archaeon]
MKLIPLKENIEDYLCSSEIIDFDNQLVAKKAIELSKGMKTDIQKAKSIYEFVRDEINHSLDINSNEITYRASDVLKKGHGLCFTKSHLLAALLRCENIPTGFCYQKLSTNFGKIFHGLNGVFLDEKWFRLDARGNTGEINAQFSLNGEKLAYIPQKEIWDVDYPYIYSNPCPEIIEILQSNSKLDEAINQIIDLI